MLTNTWQLARKELSYQIRSRVILILTFLFNSLCILNYQFLHSDVIQQYNTYENTKQGMIEQGFNTKEELQKTPKVSSASGIEEIENVLAYDLQEVEHSLLDFQSDKVLNNNFGWLSFVFFSFIFSIYGIFVATYDYK